MLLLIVACLISCTILITFPLPCTLQDKKSKEDKSYLEDAVSGDKDDDFGSDGEDNGPTEHVDDANAMGEYKPVLVIFAYFPSCSYTPFPSQSFER